MSYLRPATIALLPLGVAVGAVLVAALLVDSLDLSEAGAQPPGGTLAGLRFDGGANELNPIEIDPATGGLTEFPALADAFLLGDAAAFDATNDHLIFPAMFGAEPDSPHRLFVVDAQTGAIVTNPLLPPNGAFGIRTLHFDPSGGTLVGLRFDGGANELNPIEIDPATGGLTEFPALADVFLLGDAAAFDATNDHLIFPAMFGAEPDSPHRLFVVDAQTGAIVTNPLLPPNGAFGIRTLHFDPSGGTLVGLRFDDGANELNPIEIDPATGDLTEFPALADVFLLGDAAAFDATNDHLIFPAMFGAEPDSPHRLFVVDAQTGAIVTNPLLPPNGAFGIRTLHFDGGVNTPVGTNVCVPLNGGLGNVGGVETCFSGVTAAGNTTVATTSGGPPPPTGLKIVGTGGQPVYYDINTTAGFSAPLTVCIRYDETEVAGQEDRLRLMHDVGVWEDITLLPVDTVNDIICGETDTLSVFAVMEASPPVGGIAELLDVEPAAAPSRSVRSGPNTGVLAGLSAGAALLLAAGAWYVRTRWLRPRA